jgi:hypothetical protein
MSAREVSFISLHKGALTQASAFDFLATKFAQKILRNALNACVGEPIIPAYGKEGGQCLNRTKLLK